MGKTIDEFISEFKSLLPDKKFVDRPGDEFIELKGSLEEKNDGTEMWGVFPDFFDGDKSFASYYKKDKIKRDGKEVEVTYGLHLFWDTKNVIKFMKRRDNMLIITVPKRASFLHFIINQDKNRMPVVSSFFDYNGLRIQGQGILFSPDSKSPTHPPQGIVEISL